MIRTKTHDETVDSILRAVGPDVRLGTPLGLGKPNQLINAIYERVALDRTLKLTIFTALSLDIPAAQTELEKRFTRPFFSRHFGENYPALRYVHDRRHGKLPSSVEVREFYTAAGQVLGNESGQQSYTSLNYTHAARGIADQGINVLVQLVARSDDPYKQKVSLSCNSDLTLDLSDLMKARGKPFFKVGVIHPDLPYLCGDAEVDVEFFDALLTTDELHQPLFALPKNQISLPDHLIGLHASRIIKDGGTLQIGIGSLSDALVHSTLLRHTQNTVYQKALGTFCQPPIQSYSSKSESRAVSRFESDSAPFEVGLYGVSEMIMDGFMHLRKAGVLKRTIKEANALTKTYLHGGFFLGSHDFYKWLRSLKGDDLSGLSMTRISKINDLYDADETSLRRQRVHARFFNTCAEATLLGGAASDTLRSGQVLSGVGGQYNFVAEAAELEDAHSVLMLRATRHENGKLRSNIAMGHPHLTIPRHLRDIYITEYGRADLKACTDQECCAAMIAIADSRFQAELIAQAQSALKLPKNFQLPASAKNNTPENLRQLLHESQLKEHFGPSPFGSDFTPVELKLQTALLALKGSSKLQLVSSLWRGLRRSKVSFEPELGRLDLYNVTLFMSFVYQRLVIGALDLQRSRQQPARSL
jgi:acyl-CoA hydrolase